jgi:hypothetical protein
MARNSPTLSTVAQFKAKYLSAVDEIVAKGWAPSEILLITPWYITYYGQMLCDAVETPSVARHEAFVLAAKEVAMAKGTMLWDAYGAMKNSGNTYVLNPPDGVHPSTNEAHTWIAEQLAAHDYSVYTGD